MKQIIPGTQKFVSFLMQLKVGAIFFWEIQNDAFLLMKNIDKIYQNGRKNYIK